MYTAWPDPLFVHETNIWPACNPSSRHISLPSMLTVLVNAIFYALTSLLHSHLHACQHSLFFTTAYEA